jgi:hypothetical protein
MAALDHSVLFRWRSFHGGEVPLCDPFDRRVWPFEVPACDFDNGFEVLRQPVAVLPRLGKLPSQYRNASAMRLVGMVGIYVLCSVFPISQLLTRLGKLAVTHPKQRLHVCKRSIRTPKRDGNWLSWVYIFPFAQVLNQRFGVTHGLPPSFGGP